MEKDSEKLVKEDLYFYCIAREDGMVPCETQCFTCLESQKKLKK